MPNKGTDATATMMIVVDEVDPSTDPKTYQYVYVGNINNLPSDVLTEESIINDLSTGGTDKPLSAEQGRALNSHVNYTTCGSNAGDQVKLISDDGFELSTHLRLLVRMTNTNTNATPKFNINNTGIKDVWYNGAVASDTNTWSAGEVLDVYYDGTKYITNTHGGAQFSTGQKVGNVGIDNVPTAGSDNLVKSGGVKSYVGVATYDKLSSEEDNSDADLNFGDKAGGVILQLKGGNLKTKNFDSQKVVLDIQSLKQTGVDTALDDSSADLNIGDQYGGVILQIKKGNIRTKNFDSSNVETNVLCKRKAVMSFSFDDGPEEDATIKALFDEYGLKCGFAVISISDRYKTYYDQGFEIMAHGNLPSEWTESSLRNLIESDLSAFANKDIKCYSWVTPSSELPIALRPIVYEYFEIGYTQYMGNIITPVSDAVMGLDFKSYELGRTNLQDTNATLENMKAIVDYAVANSKMIHIYAHAANITSTKLQLLRDILTYAEGKIEVLTPVQACRKYYSYRFNEDYRTLNS